MSEIGARRREPEPELLRGERIKETRPLWEECFAEDSTSFVDYYYEYKAGRNVCFVLRFEGRIRSMLFLTPYDICVMQEEREAKRGKSREETDGHREKSSMLYSVYPTYYIVGVATQREYRHRGYMTRLLGAAFDYMRRQKVLFTFLMPANPAIYEPFGFRYIYARESWRLCPEFLQSHRQVRIHMAGDADCDTLAGFSMHRLPQRYRFFLKRDADYYRLLIRELQSENGGIRMVYVGHQFAGYYLYAREQEEFVQEALFERSYEPLLVGREGLLFPEEDKKPVIMGKYLGDVGECVVDQGAVDQGAADQGAVLLREGSSEDDDALLALTQGGLQEGLINELV